MLPSIVQIPLGQFAFTVRLVACFDRGRLLGLDRPAALAGVRPQINHHAQ